MRWPAISLFISSFSFFLSFFLSLYSILAENFICWSNFLFFELLLLLLLDFKRFHPNLPRISEEDQHWIGQPKAIDRFLLFLSAGRMAKHPPATERSTERERETHTHTHTQAPGEASNTLQVNLFMRMFTSTAPKRINTTLEAKRPFPFHILFSLSLSLFFSLFFLLFYLFSYVFIFFILFSNLIFAINLAFEWIRSQNGR